jgi:hypothetical protein
LRKKKSSTLRPMKLREYSHSRERVHSVRRLRFVEKEKAVDAKTEKAEGILTP